MDTKQNHLFHDIVDKSTDQRVERCYVKNQINDSIISLYFYHVCRNNRLICPPLFAAFFALRLTSGG